MGQQSLVSNHSEEWQQTPSASAFVSDRHRAALQILEVSFHARQPLIILTSAGKTDALNVLGRFFAGLGEDVDVVRIAKPQMDATANLREIVRAIGFDPKEMDAGDLEKVLQMYLGHQRKHGKRTILCLEEAQNNGWWVLESVRRLVEFEVKNKTDLTVILSGKPEMHELFNRPPLKSIRAHTGQRVVLTPLNPEETRDYVRQQVESTGEHHLADIFEYNALSLMHERSAGVPDDIDTLCSKCLELVEEEGAETVTADIVEEAARRMKPLNFNQNGEKGAQLIARVNDELVEVKPVNRRRLLVGRDKLCDIRLPSPYVSRHQALIVTSSGGVKILDLGSRNGTRVNGEYIKDYVLCDKDIIAFGDATIEFLSGEPDE